MLPKICLDESARHKESQHTLAAPQPCANAGVYLFEEVLAPMWGTLSGSMKPIVLKKFKLDPATSSAPLVATLVDVTGLVIYFTIAAIILKGTIL